jgi:hypothetical protein
MSQNRIFNERFDQKSVVISHRIRTTAEALYWPWPVFAKMFAKNGAFPAARNAAKNGAFSSGLLFPLLT